METLKCENQKLKNELASCKDDAKTERKNFNDQNAKLSKIITEKVEAIKKLEYDMKIEKNRSTSVEKQLTVTLQSVTEENNDLICTKTMLEKKVKETEQNMKLLVNENYYLQNQIVTEQTQYEKLRRINPNLTKTIAENTKDKESRDSTIINLQHYLQEANKTIAKLNKNVEETENMAVYFEHSSEESNKKKSNLEERLKTTENKAHLKHSLQEANKTIAKLNKNVENNLEDDINLEKTRTTTEQRMKLQECENCGLRNQIVEKQTQCDPSRTENQELLAQLTIILDDHERDKENSELKITDLEKKLLDQKSHLKDLKHSLEEAKKTIAKLKQTQETTENRVKSIVDAVTSYSQNELDKLSTKTFDHTRIITYDQITTVAHRKRMDTPKAKSEILNNSKEEEQKIDEATFTKKLHGIKVRLNLISRQVKKCSETTDPGHIEGCRKLLNGLMQDLNNARTGTHKKEKQEVKDNINLLLQQLNTFS